MNGAPPRPEPALFVVFGATGDLMRRKLLPSLFQLAQRDGGAVPMAVLGVARSSKFDDGSYRADATEMLRAAGRFDPAKVERFVGDRLFYHSLGAAGPSDYVALAGRIASIERSLGLPGNRVVYLALPLSAFGETVDGLGTSGLDRAPGWVRLVLEKPFGHDLGSARALNALVHAHFPETQVYRIDHYLGKETVQNLLVFRFANTLFESLWSRDRVDRVELTVAESLGVESRAEYYEEAGALRDMVQNHLTQLLTLIAMEVPAVYDSESIRNEKVKVLRAISPVAKKDAVFGQYGPGAVEGVAVGGYRAEPGISATSATETFVALRLGIENWRWHGVPFYLRTGKRLPKRTTKLVVTFRSPPVTFFRSSGSPDGIPSNQLVITLQPDEGFDMVFEVKSPGSEVGTRTERMHFRYAEEFAKLPDDYETLLVDILRGDPTHFVRADEVEASWRIYDGLLGDRPTVRPYAAGSWGPPEADQLIQGDGERWSEV